MSVLGGLILLGTLVEAWQEAGPYRDIILKKEPYTPESLLVKALKCFSVYGNGKKILNTDPPKDGSNHLGCLSGIRYPFIAIILDIFSKVF